MIAHDVYTRWKLKNCVLSVYLMINNDFPGENPLRGDIFKTKSKKNENIKNTKNINIFKLSKNIKISYFFPSKVYVLLLCSHSGRSVGVFGWGFGVLSDLNWYPFSVVCVVNYNLLFILTITAVWIDLHELQWSDILLESLTCSVSSTDVQTRVVCCSTHP